MAGTLGHEIKRQPSAWRIILWSIAGLALLAPLVAMRFTEEVNWTASDFVFAALLIGGVGGAFEIAVRLAPNIWYRAGIAFALAASFLTIWANGAVGMIGSEGNPYNLLFVGVIGLAMIGAVAARFRARGMAIAMLAAGLAYLAVAIGGMATDLRGGLFSAAFAGLWLLSAALFRNAASPNA